MSLPRLVLITRRFWPLVGGAELVMARLAAAFQAAGASTLILTARWQPDWPHEIEHHGVRVVRLRNSPQRVWGTWRYMQAIRAWLKSHRGEFDLAYVSMLKHDAYAALTAAQKFPFPVAVRAECAGLTGDCHWQLQARFGQRIKRRCMHASALIAPGPAVERELIAAGYPRERIHYISNGVNVSRPRDSAGRAAARAALAEVHPALAAPDAAPIVVYTGRLNPVKGLDDLVAAWPDVLSRHPAARLWLVGEGPERDRLIRLSKDLGLSGHVVLPGPFDDVDDFLQAADIFVLPSREEGMSMALLEAMAAGLPVVASAIPANQVLIEDGLQGRLVPTGAPSVLAATICEVLSQPQQAAALGEQARARVAARYSLDKMVEDHLALFSQLARSA